jgi:type I restriction enzyme, S subunit
MKSATTKLAKIAVINPSMVNHSSSNDELVAFVPMASVLADPPTVTVSEIRPLSSVKNGFSYFQDGDILFAKITPCFENGKIAQARIQQRHGFGSTEFHVVRPSENYVDARYLLHFLRQDYIRLDGERKMTGSAGQRRVPKHFLETLEIPLPPIAEQKRIAAILDKAEEIRSQRRQALEQLDAIGQSIFLEMFGDPVRNPKANKVVRLSDVTTRITDGVHQKPNYTESGVPFISVKDITTGTLKFDNCKFISLEDHKKFTKRCGPEFQDILYTKVGATYGRPALIDTDKEFSIYVSVCLLKPRRDIIDPSFLCAALGTTAIKKQADRKIKGIGVPDLHLDQIQSFLIPLPSMSQQQEFTRRVETIAQLKTTHRESLAQLDDLFTSLQHRAFRGEL